MNQEISISYRAVKSKIYKLIDALVEGEKNEAEVQESIRRWWKMVRPGGRALAEKYRSSVRNRSRASRHPVRGGIPTYEAFELGHQHSVRVGNRQPAA